ncbi:MAG: FAD-binding oxidoreductase [Thermoplasmata archaeon]|nr:FAD-binding oxidoreductase [Thermoplasmata archaeon]
MENKIYSLWGDEKKLFKTNEALYDYIFKMLNVEKSNIEWDGYYTLNNLGSDEKLKEKLLQCLPLERISFDAKERFYHSIGKGSIEYARLIEKRDFRIVDAVVYPKEDEIPCLFNKLTDTEFITFGGGTSVTGGILPSAKKRYSISIDTRNLDYFDLDIDSMILEAGAGIKGPDLEENLKRFNLTLGNFPESFEYSTLGGWIATNAAGQESNRYGKIKDMVLGVKLINPSGIYMDHKVPAESAFFRISDIAVGSEGSYGIITRAWLKVHKIPEKLFFKSYMFRNFEEGLNAIRDEFTQGNSPMVSRLSDETETYLSMLAIEDNILTKLFKSYLKSRNVLDKGSILIVMDDKKVNLHGGIGLGSTPAKLWKKTRYDRPYMYNELLKHGIIAETIETSTPWSSAYLLYKNVISSFNEKIIELNSKGIIMCHASHEYVSGTALYFTFLFYSKNNKEEVLKELRRNVINSILEHGGSISHHHGIGTYLSDEFIFYKGNTMKIIRSLKKNFDENNVLNPGIIKY